MASGGLRGPARDGRRAGAAAALVLLVASIHAGARPRVVPDGDGLIPYFMAPPAEASGFRPGDAELAIWALAEWERRLPGVRFVRTDDERAARVHFAWLPWAEDAALGRMEALTRDGHVVATVALRPDESYFRPSVRRRVSVDPLMRDVVLYYVCLHEVGHALGLSHSDNPRDVMWPGANGVTLPVYDRYRHLLQTRDDIPRTSWLSDADVRRAAALGHP